MRLASSLSLVLLASCAETPTSGSHVVAGTAFLTFSGRSPYTTSRTVEIQALARDGGWRTIDVVGVGADDRWSASVHVGEDFWWRPPCDAARFRFQTQAGDTIWGLDEACLRALGSSPATLDRVACAVREVDVLRPRMYGGDLVVDGPAPDERYTCIGEVQGNLTIRAGQGASRQNVFEAGVQFSLPRLAVVRGSLSIDGGRTESVRLPVLEEVGGDLTVQSWHFLAADFPAGGTPTGIRQAVNRIELPVLRSFYGALMVTASEAPGGTFGPGPVRHVYEVPGVTEALSVEVHVTSPAAAPSGLSGLHRTFGLIFDWGTGDLDANDLLGRLDYVGGDARFSLPANAVRALPELSYVHTLVLAPAGPGPVTLYPEFLPDLTFVVGDLVASEVASPPVCALGLVLPHLESVRGTLRLEGGALQVPIGMTARPLRLGGIELSGTGAEHVPLYGEILLSDAARVSFTDNPALCDCQIGTFAERLTAEGWTGALTSTGNGGAAVCTPCPDVACLP